MANYIKVSSLNLYDVPFESVPKDTDRDVYMASHLEKQIEKVLPDKPDLIVLPECADRLYGIPTELYGIKLGKAPVVFQKLSAIARKNKCYIAYPTRLIKDDGTKRNACVMIDRNGEVNGIYHKNFLVPFETHTHGILPGKDMTLFECDFGKVGAVICFDLNFEENRQRLRDLKPDLVIFSSMYHGGLAQKFFAYDTRSYLVSAIGGERQTCSVISPHGEVIAETTENYNYLTEKINLDYAVIHIDENASKLKKAKQKYGDKIKIHVPRNIGNVRLSSETDEFTVKDIIKEFDLETIDDYFNRARAHREKYMETDKE